MTVFAILKMLLTLGPEVLTLVGEVIKAIQGDGASKDRKKAERALFVKAWALRHGVAYPYDTQEPNDRK